MGCLHYLVAILGAILVTTLPWSNKVGLLFSYWIASTCHSLRFLHLAHLCAVNEIVPFVIFLAWVGNVTAGHTKRVTTNAIVMVGYAVGNSVGPQYWQTRYQPRNRVPWAILAACWAASLLILLATRFYLAAENRKRDREPRDATYDDVYVVDEKGEEKKVDKVRLCFSLWRRVSDERMGYRLSSTSRTCRTGTSDTSCEYVCNEWVGGLVCADGEKEAWDVSYIFGLFA